MVDEREKVVNNERPFFSFEVDVDVVVVVVVLGLLMFVCRARWFLERLPNHDLNFVSLLFCFCLLFVLMLTDKQNHIDIISLPCFT